MRTLVPWIWIAGTVQIALIVANIGLPRMIQCRENLQKVPPLMRQIFIVHWIYIVLVLAIFSALCLFFARDLAGASLLGRFLAGAMGVFWLLRVPLQIFYYDGEVRRRHRVSDVAYILATAYLGIVFLIAALGARR